ncbi:hypothetical protein L3073_04440 [Ancylomarina sp. DW003]|nr:hypothetical protein [Ancylomarina sp. DW003]MDE5421449.1 hypothetical protein [Ancylomarina sp. DW003]
MKLLQDNVDLKEFENLVDSNLSEMYNPKINNSIEFKKRVKLNTLKYSDKGIDIIKTYFETKEFVGIDNLLNKIDSLIIGLQELLDSITDKYEAISVGTIWNSFFGQLQREVPQVDKNIFIYAEMELLDVLNKRMKKQRTTSH